MKKSIIKISLLGLLAVAIAGLPVCASAANTNAPATNEKSEVKPKKSPAIPFHGKLKAVDKTAKTISVGDMTIQVTSETKIMKTGKPAMLEDGVVGEEVSGQYKRAADGKFEATSVRFGAKPGKGTKTEADKEKAQ